MTCLAFNPLINKLLLVGTGHGQLNLYTTGRGSSSLFTLSRSLISSFIDEPILTLTKAFRSSSSVLSCNWSSGRPSVFFAHDSQGYIKYWDLTKDYYEPIGRIQIDKYENEIHSPFISLLQSFSFSLSHFVLSSSNQFETAFALVVKQQSNKIEVHQLKRALATHSDAFNDNFKLVLKEIMTNV